MKKISLLKIFWIFLKIGAIALGGGYVILPIIKTEIVDKRELISNEDLMDYFVVSQSLPGIIAANISMFTGHKLRGLQGAIVATLGVITIPFFSIVLLASILGKLLSNVYVQGVFWGVGIAVVALLMLTARELWRNTKRDLFFYLIFIFSLVSLLIFNISPISTILIFVMLGVVFKIVVMRCKK